MGCWSGCQNSRVLLWFLFSRTVWFILNPFVYIAKSKSFTQFPVYVCCHFVMLSFAFFWGKLDTFTDYVVHFSLCHFPHRRSCYYLFRFDIDFLDAFILGCIRGQFISLAVLYIAKYIMIFVCNIFCLSLKFSLQYFLCAFSFIVAFFTQINFVIF